MWSILLRGLAVPFPSRHDVSKHLLSAHAPFRAAQHFVDGVPFYCIGQTNFPFDEFHDLFGGGRGIELEGMELAVHEVEASVYGPSVDGAEDLLFGGRPLPSPVVQRFQQAFFSVTGIFALFGDVIHAASLQVRSQVLADKLVGGRDDGTIEREEGPLPQVDPRIAVRMVGRLLDELHVRLIEKNIRLHALLQQPLHQPQLVLIHWCTRISISVETRVSEDGQGYLKGLLLDLGLRYFSERLR